MPSSWFREMECVGERFFVKILMRVGTFLRISVIRHMNGRQLRKPIVWHPRFL